MPSQLLCCTSMKDAEKKDTGKSRQGGMRSEEILTPIPIGMLVFGVPAHIAGLDGGAFWAVAVAGGVIFFVLHIYFQYFRS